LNVTQIVMLRHGHVDWHDPERFRGRAELALSDLGRRQARAAALHLATGSRPDAIYSSPLLRCRDTAAAIAAPFRLAVQPVEGLADIDYGAWQGLTRDEAAARWPDEIDLWFRAPHLASIPGGETLAALLSRTGAALHDILRRHPIETLVIVGHDSVNRVLLLHAMELPLSRYWHLRQDPCGIDTLSFANGSFVIGSLNETQHLAALR
jgi:broad specificity phosphatase PhoE